MEGNSSTDNMLGMGTKSYGITLAEALKNSLGKIDIATAGSVRYLKITSYDRLGFKGDGNNKISVYMRMGSDAEWLAHEFGHAVYMTGNLLLYYFLVREKNLPAGGHGTGDPSGEKATEFQDRYKKNKSKNKKN